MSAPVSKGGSSNTLPQNTKPEFDSVSVDWFSGTIPANLDGVTEVSRLLGIRPGEWVEGRGGMGYRHSWRHPSGAILYDQGNDHDHGQHLVLSGSVCSSLGLAWASFLSSWLELRGKVARLDLAIDDVTGWVDLNRLVAAVNQGTVVSRYSSPVRVYESLDPLTGASLGKTVYFGSGKGNSLVRFYNKAQEQNVEGPWVRAEIQYRHESALAVATRIVNGADLVELSFGLLDGLVSVRERGKDSNRSRWPVQTWWGAFLRGVKRFSLGVSRVRNPMKKKLEWLARSCSKGLAQAATYAGVEFIAGLVTSGIGKTTEAEWLELGFIPSIDFASVLGPLKELGGFSDERKITEFDFTASGLPG